MFKINVFNKTETRIASQNFQVLASRAAKMLELRKVIRCKKSFLAELTFIGESAMRRINKKYRRKNKPADVISLGYFDASVKDPFVGEIFVCIPYARRQAKSFRHSLQHELEFLFVHGFLHIFGYDHKNLKDEVKMNALIKEILI